MHYCFAITHMSGLPTPCIINSIRSIYFWVHPNQISLRSDFTQIRSRWDLISNKWTLPNLLIGQCGLLIQSIQNVERLEIGYSILPKYWHKGYASESAIKCKNYAFENNLSDSLISMVHVENIGSEKVALKNGMILEQKIDSYEGSPVNIFRIDKKKWK